MLRLIYAVVFASFCVLFLTVAEPLEAQATDAEAPIAEGDGDPLVVAEPEELIPSDGDVTAAPDGGAEAPPVEGEMAMAASTAESSTEPAGQIGFPAALVPDVVGAGGAFTQRIEIALPEFRDLPLPVALTYNSSDISRSGADKFVAFGWGLQGFSSIERKSLGGGVPSFDDGQDVYLLDGVELMACAGPQATNPWPLYYPLRYLTDSASASCATGGGSSDGT